MQYPGCALPFPSVVWDIMVLVTNQIQLYFYKVHQ